MANPTTKKKLKEMPILPYEKLRCYLERWM